MYKSLLDISLFFIISRCIVFVGLKSLMYTNANLTAFHNLLQNCLYPTTRLISRFTSRPCTVYASNPNLKASAPHSGMPSGKSIV